MRVAVVGGGLFGLLSAVELSREHHVTLFESSDQLMQRASKVNQARLHTGMHYPRDFETAKDALADFERFRSRFPASVRDIDQYYGLHFDSKVSYSDFINHASRLGLAYSEIKPERFFKPGRIEGLILVPEASFSFEIVRQSLIRDVEDSNSVELAMGVTVTRIREEEDLVLETSRGVFRFDRLVVATYSTLSTFAKQLGVETPPFRSQLAQVLLGKFSGLPNTGITVMDGPFWSTMPFGANDLHSLTHVSKTPILQTHSGLLSCQEATPGCGRQTILDCDSCPNRPPNDIRALIEACQSDMHDDYHFEFSHSLLTVKSLLGDKASTEKDARPSSAFFSSSRKAVLIHSGKVGSAIRIAEQLQLERSSL